MKYFNIATTINNMATSNVPLKALLYVILSTLKNSEIVEIVGVAQCLISQNLSLLKLMIFINYYD